MSHDKSGFDQQPPQIVVGLVVQVVAAAVAHEIADIPEILADGEQPRPLVAEPRFPMTDDLRVEIEFAAAPDFPGKARGGWSHYFSLRDPVISFLEIQARLLDGQKGRPGGHQGFHHLAQGGIVSGELE